MRILFLTDDYLPHHGGSRVYYHELLSRLEQHDILVLTRQRRGDADFDSKQSYQIQRCKLESANWLRPIRLQFLPLYFNLLSNTIRLCRSFKPDIIFAGELVPTGPVAALIAQYKKTPLLVFTHAEGPSTLKNTRFQSRLARWVCNKSQQIVTGSQPAADILVEDFNVAKEKIDVLLPAVSESHFDSKYQSRPFSQPNNSTKLLSVGRLILRKGHRQVLEAIAQLRDANQKLDYTIIGTGPEESRLKERIKNLNLDNCVKIKNGLTNDEVLQHYAQSDIFILPNQDNPQTGDTEGFGIVFIEASAHKLPVIGGKTDGTRASIKHNQTGLRVEGNDPQKVAQAILQLINDPQSAIRMGEEGYVFAKREMRWQQRVTHFSTLLDRLI